VENWTSGTASRPTGPTGPRVSPESVAAGAFRLNGTARAVEGGDIVSGRWSLGSGIPHATWALGGGHIYDGEALREGLNGGPVPLIAFFPKAEADVLEMWHVAGLCGTGGHDYQVSELFVPEHRTRWWSDEPVATERFTRCQQSRFLLR
jgi:hypothetical protein